MKTTESNDRGYVPASITVGRLVEALEQSYRLQFKMWEFIQSAVRDDVPDDSPQGEIFVAHEAISTEIAWCFAEMALNNCEPCLHDLVDKDTQSPSEETHRKTCAERDRIRKMMMLKLEKINAEFQHSFDDGKIPDENWKVARQCEMDLLREILREI